MQIVEDIVSQTFKKEICEMLTLQRQQGRFWLLSSPLNSDDDTDTESSVQTTPISISTYLDATEDTRQDLHEKSEGLV
jgi:hypothetical protein